MKKIVTAMMIAILSISGLFAQNTLKDVVKDYQNKNREFTLVIPSFIIKIGMAYGDIEADKREAMKMIDGMKIVVSEKAFQKHDFTMLDEGIKNGNFKELMTVNDSGEKIRMVMNQKSKRKSEMLMLLESDEDNVLMLFNFHGEPDFKKFVALTD